MAYIVPGSDAANQARWASLTPEQRAAAQKYVDDARARADTTPTWLKVLPEIVKYGVLGTVGVGAGAGVLGALAPAAGSTALPATAFSASPYVGTASMVSPSAGGSMIGALTGTGATAAALPSTGFAATPYAGTASMVSPSAGAGGGGLMTADNLRRAQNIGRIAGNAAKGSSDERQNENQQRLSQSQIQNNAAMDLAKLDLDRAKFSQDEPNARASQAVRGSMLQNLQPLQMSGLSSRVNIPKMNSIINALGPEARQAGSLLSSLGVSGLQNPTKFAPVPMQTADLKKSGMLEQILGGVGLGASMVGSLGDMDSVEGFY